MSMMVQLIQVAHLAVYDAGVPVPLHSWSPIKLVRHAIDPSWAVMAICEFTGSFRRGLYNRTTLGDYLTGKQVRVVATLTNGSRLSFKAVVCQEDWHGNCDYASCGPPDEGSDVLGNSEEADTPAFITGPAE